jgi:hypothetical protein
MSRASFFEVERGAIGRAEDSGRRRGVRCCGISRGFDQAGVWALNEQQRRFSINGSRSVRSP